MEASVKLTQNLDNSFILRSIVACGVTNHELAEEDFVKDVFCIRRLCCKLLSRYSLAIFM